MPLLQYSKEEGLAASDLADRFDWIVTASPTDEDNEGIEDDVDVDVDGSVTSSSSSSPSYSVAGAAASLSSSGSSSVTTATAAASALQKRRAAILVDFEVREVIYAFDSIHFCRPLPLPPPPALKDWLGLGLGLVQSSSFSPISWSAYFSVRADAASDVDAADADADGDGVVTGDDGFGGGGVAYRSIRWPIVPLCMELRPSLYLLRRRAEGGVDKGV